MFHMVFEISDAQRENEEPQKHPAPFGLRIPDRFALHDGSVAFFHFRRRTPRFFLHVVAGAFVFGRDDALLLIRAAVSFSFFFFSRVPIPFRFDVK